MNNHDQPQEFHLNVDNTESSVVSLLSLETGFSKQKIKKCMQKGAVWLTHKKHTRRIRRASLKPQVGDECHLYYNERVLNKDSPHAVLIDDKKDYSIWYKPYGMLSQGSKWSDHCTISRWAEQHLQPERPAFIVHRLDRATSGLIVVAHSKSMARSLSALFETRAIKKRYQAIVHGDFSVFPQDYEVDRMVDGKAARSVFSFADNKDDCSLVDVRLLTGRKHQIRQHLSALGYPIVGDRLYGCGDSEGRDLQLQSVSLRFTCPITDREQHYSVADHQRIQL
jgi:tRNA pseudouridine32 synthase/23S rRNA pseudouridine746 synthase